MCRWLAYKGSSIRLQDLLFEPKQNLIDQSMSSRSAETPTNGDGFGLGWYGSQPKPGLYKSLRPAWNDFNLRDLADNIESPLFMAHVRATSLATVQETNCHPFRYNNWMFVHNGEIFEIEKYRKELVTAIDEKYFENIMGTTDSEIMFHLALSFGLENNTLAALEKTVGFIEKTSRNHGVEESVWLTIGLSDGKNLWAVRYASDGKAPTLYLSPTPAELEKVNPAIKNKFTPNTRCIVSEPMGKFQDIWTEIPQSSVVVIHDTKVENFKFKPQP